MAQALAEQVFPWVGDSVCWPPRAALAGSASFEVEGTVLRHYALNVRKANEQQGFLKSAVSSDVNVKHRALELKLTSVKNLATGASVPLTDLAKVFGPFIQLASGSSASSPHLLPAAAGTAVFWAESTLQSELSSKFDGKPVELSLAFVRLQTEGSTLVARSVEVLHQAAENKYKPSLDSQPNLFAQAQGKFNPPPAMAAAKPKKQDDDDDWED